jgi:ABC-2 type transport system permease protein
MRRVLTIAQSEFVRLTRSKAFIIGILLMPVLVGAMITFMGYAQRQVDREEREFAVVDLTGDLYEPLAAAARDYNAKPGEHGEPHTGPRFTPRRIDLEGRDVEAVKLELSEQVRRKALFAFVVIPATALAPSEKPDPIQYYTDTIGYETLPDWLRPTLRDEITKQRASRAGLDPAMVATLISRPELSTFRPLARGADGRVAESRKVDAIATLGPPVFFLVLMFMAVMTSAQHLLNAIIEEKMSRICEVLVGSVTPFQLMMGKLAGVSAVSVLLVLVYFSGALFLVFRSGRWDLLNVGLMGWFVLFLICAALMYGAIFLALGSACSSISDAQSLLQPAMMLLLLAYLGSFVVMRAPDSKLAVAMSLFPTMTPFSMMLRIAVPPGAPLWQVAIAVALLVASTIAVVWAASRVFRIGILMQGKAPNLPELLRWIRA